MSAADPKITLRLEPALRQLARNSALGLAWLARRHDVGEDEIRAWLDQFNGGKKALVEATIDSVKVQVGLITSGRTSTKPQPAIAAAPQQPKLAPAAKPAAAPAPVVPDAPAQAPQRTAETRPWEQSGRAVRASSFMKYRPILVQLADGGESVNAWDVCAKADLCAQSLYEFSKRWLGKMAGHSPEHIRAFIAWGDRSIASKENEPRPAQPPAEKPAAAPVVAGAAAVRKPILPRAEKPVAVVQLPGTLFRLELTVRLIPIAAGSEDTVKGVAS